MDRVDADGLTVECHGNGDDHCCWLYGEECQFLESGTVEGRRWSCGLRRELGSWEAVHDDDRYLTLVEPVLHSFDVESCGSWGPGMGQCCYEEVG